MKKLLLVLVLSAMALWAQIKCPVDGQNCYFTGKTEIVSGVLMKQYKCPMGHLSWAR